MRILSYGVAADAVDDYIRIGESTAIQKYLRSQTPTDIARLLAIGELRMGYYLADGLYPQWETLVQTISSPQGAKRQHFAMMQESARKDVERAFGVLQSRFTVISGVVRYWDSKMLANITKSCIILHNMIVEDEREEHLDFNYDISSTNTPVQLFSTPTNDFQLFLSRHLGIRDKDAYPALRNDLVEHMWYLHGEH
ncbi:uncharacterized protein LOC114314560 [Camellia sinensis]|uniref:uncharacterized protein LOC114314560 n=1 Tax=Camellia sinensis TaxID=4442 RepID=UPI001035CCA7|nr:uncharacterized protein LOC114314560 [Camellia sinensis]